MKIFPLLRSLLVSLLVWSAVGLAAETPRLPLARENSGEASGLAAETFAVTESTVARMIDWMAPADSADPFAVAPSVSTGSGQAAAIRDFLQAAGVNFKGVSGAGLVLDGSTIGVTQTARNLDRIRDLMNQLNHPRRIAFEVKCIEARQVDMTELKIDWAKIELGRPATAQVRDKWQCFVVKRPDADAVLAALTKKSSTLQIAEQTFKELAGVPCSFTWAEGLDYPATYGGAAQKRDPRRAAFQLAFTATADDSNRAIGINYNSRATTLFGFAEHSEQSVADTKITAETNATTIFGGPAPSATVPVVAAHPVFEPVFAAIEASGETSLPDGATLVLQLPLSAVASFSDDKTAALLQAGLSAEDRKSLAAYVGLFFVTAKIVAPSEK